MSSHMQPEFSKLRAALWPIHGYEMKKFLPMAAILFFVLFNYTVVRALKDVLISTAPNSGAEVFNFLKFWIVLPSSVAFVVLYAKLSNALSREKLYYACLLPFPIFFAIFTFLIHPNVDFLHPDPAYIRALQEAYPNFQWLFPVYGVWTYSLFYTFAELWGNVGTAIIFWQFANEVTKTDEAKRYYSLFGFLANFALIGAGQALKKFDFDTLIHLVILGGAAIAFIYWWMGRAVLTDPRYYEKASAPKKAKEKKPKLSISESFKLLIHSKYLGYIAILVLGYGMTINLIEVTWKNQVRELYPDPRDLKAFFGDFYSWVGAATIILMFTTKGVVRRFGWFTGAITTPTMILVTGSLFFAFVLINDFFPGTFSLMGFTPLFLAVMIGGAQNVLGKGTKYSLFDPTKEMAYIPLDQELKVKGKAAVDVIGSRLGKSGGGIVQQVLLIVTAGNQLTIAPALSVLVILIVLIWIWAVKRLSNEYNALVEEKPKK
ncbi:MAG: Npt1/Npt2 family nucleotide transporter [Alphaproteobacteria bacterium]